MIKTGVVKSYDVYINHETYRSFLWNYITNYLEKIDGIMSVCITLNSISVIL